MLPKPVLRSTAALATVTIASYAIGLILGFTLMELPCYADYCIENVQPMAKESSRVALGLFYLWAAATVLAVRLMEANGNLKRKVCNPIFVSRRFGVFSLGHIFATLWVAALFAFNLGYFTVRVEGLLNSPAYVNRNLVPSRRKAFFWTMMTGKLTDVSMGLVLLLSAKSSGLQQLLGTSFDRGLWLHRGIGYFFWVVTAIHTILYVVFTAQYRTVENLISLMFYGGYNSATHGEHAPGWGQGNWMVTMGVYSVVFFVPVSILSLPWVRRRFFNVFYFAHFLVFPGMAFAWLHAASDFYYCIPGLGLYAYDLFLRARAAVTPIVVVKVHTNEPAGLIRVDFAWPEGIPRTAAGTLWALFNIPWISKHEWHPYSFAQPPSSAEGSIVFKARKTSEWESKAAEFLKSSVGAFETASKNTLMLRMDGPFGAPVFDAAAQDMVVCMVAGTGVVPAVSLLWQAVESGGRCKKIGLFWSVKSPNGASASILQELMAKSPVPFVCAVHQTSLDDSSTTQDDIQSSEKTLGVGASIQSMAGRLNAQDKLASFVEPGCRNLGVFVCGPESFSIEMLSGVLEFERSHKEMALSVHHEGFLF